MTVLHDILRHRTSTQPAVRTPEGVFSYREVVDLASRFAGGFRDAGLKPGDGVLVGVEQLQNVIALALGGWWKGLRVSLVRGGSPPDAKLRAAQATQPALQVWDRAIDAPLEAGRIVSCHTLLGDREKGCPICRDDDLGHESYTSGSTGSPKCVVRSHGALCADVRAIAAAMQLTPEDIVMAVLPYLSTVSVLPALVSGATVQQVPIRAHRLLRSQLSSTPMSVLVGTPYLFELLAKRGIPWRLHPSTRLVVSTSAFLRPTTARTFLSQTGLPIRSIFCTSESGNVTFNDSDEAECLIRSVGRPLPGVNLMPEPIPDGAWSGGGRIVVTSPHNATMYRGNPKLSDEVFTPTGVRTTDVGYLDEDGYLYLVGRLDDRIHVGMLVVDPIEVEEQLMKHPAVLDAMVIGQPHPRLQEIPVAWIVCASPVEDVDLVMHCREALDRYKVPRRFVRVRKIPRNKKGEILRRRADSVNHEIRAGIPAGHRSQEREGTVTPR
jgi:acyl-coenzyme A synthetase/AMP-(fatty) acid ligase